MSSAMISYEGEIQGWEAAVDARDVSAVKITFEIYTGLSPGKYGRTLSISSNDAKDSSGNKIPVERTGLYFSVSIEIAHDFGPWKGSWQEDAEGFIIWPLNTSVTHFHECKKCGAKEYQNHDIQQINDGPNGHHRECVVCGDNDKITAHDFVLNTGDETSHTMKCKTCGYVKDPENHNLENYIDNGDGTHTGTCSICEQKITKDHKLFAWVEYKTDGQDYHYSRSCEDCGYKNLEAHTWKCVPKDANSHHMMCSALMCGQIKNNSEVPHTFGNWTDNNDGTHIRTCVCGEVQSADHNWEKNYSANVEKHWKKCRECDGKKELADHDYGEWRYIEGQEGHSCTCECGAVLSEPHEYTSSIDNGDGTHNALCEECGYHVENAPHKYYGDRVDSQGNHVYDCRICGHQDIKPHPTGIWRPISATQHQCICEICERDVVGEHLGGTPDCHTLAKCELCEEYYGELDPDNHTGGTEILGKKEVTETEDGYTGDTYCKGCGEKLFDGEVIPKPVKNVSEETEPAAVEDNSQKSTESAVVKTGDESKIALLIVCLDISLILFLTLFLEKKKRRKHG